MWFVKSRVALLIQGVCSTVREALGLHVSGPVLSGLFCVPLKCLMCIFFFLKKVAVLTVVSPRICFNGKGSNVPSCSETDRQTNETMVLISHG